MVTPQQRGSVAVFLSHRDCPTTSHCVRAERGTNPELGGAEKKQQANFQRTDRADGGWMGGWGVGGGGGGGIMSVREKVKKDTQENTAESS